MSLSLFDALLWFIILNSCLPIICVPLCHDVDDGQSNSSISIDLDTAANTECKDGQWSVDTLVNKSFTNQSSLPMGHKPPDCKIEYPDGEIPNSGKHRQQYGTYGEYQFIPPGRYIHNLEHGAIVVMYHPCAPRNGVEMIKDIAKSCTWKHIITSYGSVLNQTYPYAVLLYGHVYHASAINTTHIKDWIRKTFKNLKTSEKEENEQGSYNHSLLVKSEVPTNPSSSTMCPTKITLEPTSSPSVTTIQQRVNEAAISNDSNAINTTTSSEAKHLIKSTTTTVKKVLTEAPALSTATTSIATADTTTTTAGIITSQNTEVGATPRTNEVSWAIGCLVFIVAVLALAVWKTKLWRKRAYSNDIETSKIWRDNSAPGSFSVAAIIRKLPDVITRNKVPGKTGRYKENHYSLIQDEDSSSDDEL